MVGQIVVLSPDINVTSFLLMTIEPEVVVRFSRQVMSCSPFLTITETVLSVVPAFTNTSGWSN